MESRGFTCRTIIPTDIRHAISIANLPTTAAVLWATCVGRLSDGFTERGCRRPGDSGPLVPAFLPRLFDVVELTGVAPPVTITGWVGVIIEKIVAGYLERYRPTLWL
jgi:hypothetical protein